MEYSSCSSYDSNENHRANLESLHGEYTLGLIPWVVNYETSGYKQEVTVKLLRNLHITGNIMATMLSFPGELHATNDEGPIPRRLGNRQLTAQDVIEYIQETDFDCFDVCVDQRVISVNNGTQGYRVTAIGPLSASTSLDRKQVRWFTSGNKFCIRCEVRTHSMGFQ